MDLTQLLVVAVFLLFSLIQLFLERRGSPPPPLPPPDEEAADAPARLPAPAPAEVEAPWSPGSGEWSEAPTEGVEWIAHEEVVDEEEAAELTTAQREMPADTVPEVLRVSAPVVSLESLVPERTAERDRSHRRIAEIRPLPAAPPPLAAGLRSRDALRRAVLLSEVLGPPRALR